MSTSEASPAPASRRPDRKPETKADKRFFDLRESGYRGPVDQDGRVPDARKPETRRAVSVLDALARAGRTPRSTR